MKKISFGLKGLFSTILILLVFIIPVSASTDDTQRIYGADRYKTAEAIAEHVNSGQVNSVVLAPGNSYANALPASVLAYKNNAPLLLLDSSASKTVEAFNYIKSHLSSTGTIYLVGDNKLIGYDFVTTLKSMGYSNIIKISGSDIYNTDYLIAKELNISKNTPVVISSGVNFPDALAISSMASSNSYPILLTDGKTLSNDIKAFIAEKQPSKIYITGGTSAITAAVENQLKSTVPNTEITRFAGSDRYETGTLIANQFFTNSKNIYIASGLNYPDALAGSVLAAKNNSPIVLINPNTKRSVPTSVVQLMVDYREKQVGKSLIALGGTTVVPSDIYTMTNDLAGNINLISLGNPIEFNFTFVKDPQWSHNSTVIEGNGTLTEDQELALITAINYYRQSSSIHYQMLSDNTNTFGRELCSDKLASRLQKNMVASADEYIREQYIHQVTKITLTSYGTMNILPDTPYTYFRIIAETRGYKNGNSVKATEYTMLGLYKVNGYWEIDFDQTLNRF